MTETTVLAWHFVGETKRLGYDDGREVKVGETLSYNGDSPPECCYGGMHGSVSALDALNYAPGPILCRVEISGDIDEGGDKLCGRHRKVIAMADATDMLRAFARRCALDVAHLWDMPDVVRKYLETGAEPLRDAAYAAASDAAYAAARAAASDAAMDAARDAARDAAMDAARAARAAAWDARAARAARAAARAAAWAAAWAAITLKQRTSFEALCLELIGEKEETR